MIKTVYSVINNKYEKYKENTLFPDYKKKYTLEERKEKSLSIMEKYPDRFPIICYASPQLPKLSQSKFLVTGDLSYTNFLFMLRKRMELSETQSIYIFINKKLMSSNMLIKDIYEKNKDKDGFLYAYICSENTFG